MPVYLVADIKVTDDKWVPGYAASVHELVHKHGGKYLARSGNVKTLEGEPLDATLMALIEFPSADALDRLRRRSRLCAVRRGSPPGQQKPASADRRYRSRRHNFLFAQRLTAAARRMPHQRTPNL